MKSICAAPFYAILITLLLLLFGCMNTQKATAYLQKKGELAQVCASNYPVHDSTIVRDSFSMDTLYVPSPEVVTTDTIQVAGKPVVVYKTLKCPSARIITKTIQRDSIIVRENTAKVAALQTVVDKQSVKLSDAQSGRSRWRKWCLITWLICAAIIAVRILLWQSPIELPFKI